MAEPIMKEMEMKKVGDVRIHREDFEKVFTALQYLGSPLRLGEAMHITIDYDPKEASTKFQYFHPCPVSEKTEFP